MKDYVKFGVAVLIFALAVGYNKWRVDAYKAEVQVLTNANEEMAITIDQMCQSYEATISALQSVMASDAYRAARDAELITTINEAPASDDGSIAPVLRRALDALE